MAHLLKQFIRKKPFPTRFITTLSQQNPSLNLTPNLFPIPKSIFNQVINLNPNANNGFREREDENGLEFGTHLKGLQVYPGLSLGVFLNSGLQYGSGQSKLDGVVGDEMEQNGMMWADSVKRKRKKKMNKHKFKKLRKRLRRKTKT